MRSYLCLAASLLACVSAQSTLPNHPPTYGVVGNNTIQGNGTAVGKKGEVDGKYSKLLQRYGQAQA
jgi:hypothetical protein